MLWLHDAALLWSILHWHYGVAPMRVLLWFLSTIQHFDHGCQTLERDMHAIRQARLSFTTAVVSSWPFVRFW